MEKVLAFNALIRDAYAMAEDARNSCFTDPENNVKEDKIVALSYAAACTAKYSAAAAIYWCSPELHDDSTPALLAQFDTFTDEIRDDYRDSHSRQWVDIEFERLHDLFEQSRYKLDTL